MDGKIQQEAEKEVEGNKPVTQTSTGEEKFETTPIIERAREEREKLDAANKKHEELLNRQEEINAKQMLGGGSEAGQEAEKKEETAKEYSDRILKNQVT